MLGAFNIVCIRRRCLTLSCINLGMSHKMLFYIRSMIYIDIECLESCEAREKITMLNAKDVYPRWQKSSIPKNMFYQSGPWLPSGCSKIVGQLLHSETITPTWMWWAGKLMLRFEFAQRSYHSYIRFSDIIWYVGIWYHYHIVPVSVYYFYIILYIIMLFEFELFTFIHSILDVIVAIL